MVPLRASAITGKLAIMAVLHFTHAPGGSRFTFFEEYGAGIRSAMHLFTDHAEDLARLSKLADG